MNLTREQLDYVEWFKKEAQKKEENNTFYGILGGFIFGLLIGAGIGISIYVNF